jgi:hypothetical protein
MSTAKGDALDFDLDQLDIIYNAYLALRDGGLKTVDAVAADLEVPKGRLYDLLRRFNHRTGGRLFEIKPGGGGTHFKRDPQALEALHSILRSARSLLTPTGFTVRIGTGVTACVSLLPRLLQAASGPDSPSDASRAMVFDIQSVPNHQIDARHQRYDICLTETMADPTEARSNYDTDGPSPFSPKVIKVPLKLMVLWTHPLAKVMADPAAWASLSPKEFIALIQNHRLALIEEDRQPQPHYPKKLFEHINKLDIVRCSTHALTHALVMTGTAISISTPLLLTEEQRREIEVFDLPAELEGDVRFKLECPEAGGMRTTQEREAIRRLCRKLEALVRQYESTSSPTRFKRQAWHISHSGGVAEWVRADMTWHCPTDAASVLRGRYVFRDEEYLLDGNLAHSSTSSHLVFKAMKRGGNFEEFVSSYAFPKEDLENGSPLTGIWVGRRWTHPSALPESLIPSLGFSVLLAEPHSETITAEYLNKLVRST